MSFDGTGGRGLQDLFGLLRGLGAAGPDPNDDPIAQAQADIARRARLPKVGGLFGGDYARFMADNAPAAPTSYLDGTLLGSPMQAGAGRAGVRFLPSARVFGPQAFGVETDAATIDPANNLQVAGPAVAKPYPTNLDPIVAAKVAAFNKMNQADPGDDVCMDPDWIRAIIRVESGHDLKAASRDPMQVNNTGDWPKNDDYKAQIGLTKGVPPGPELGVRAGLDWLESKANRYDSKGRPTEFLGWDEATRRYNGGGDPRYMEKVGKAYRDIKQGR